MTWAAIPLLARQPALADDWLPKLLSRDYDPRPAPLAERRCALVGMGMTEKQGGSDVRSNTTRAEPAPASEFGDRWGRPYRITGHKWFMSAPMCDAFLVLAQDGSAGGNGRHGGTALSCFLVPRWLPDGRRNRLQFQRLKDKLGNRSNASSEVEFEGTAGFLVGEPGRGIATILEMGALTRLDCAIASAGMMRRAVAEALHHASRRQAFGRPLAQQPLMQNVLADLALESEAAMRWALRLAQLLDRAGDPAADALLRIGTPLAKYWICRRAPALAFEAMEVLGGNGYVEEASLARLYREAPVNSIWEGSGNVMCLDVLRALGREPACRDALLAELNAAQGSDPRYDRFVARLLERLGRASGSTATASASGDAGGNDRASSTAGASADELFDPSQARRLAGDLARAWQAALMLRWAPAEVAAAFCAGRLDDERATGDQAFGTLPARIDLGAIVERAMPSASSS
jgi:putative acyl-CoA dehydrogenase